MKKEDAQEENKYDIKVMTDPRQKIQIELKNMDQSLFTVPEMLYAKHPLIIDTKEFFRGEKNKKYLDKNPYKSKIKAISIKEEREEIERLRHQQEEERKKRELEEQKKREKEEKRKKELKELKTAFFSAECYSLANILRSYMERYESFLTQKEIIDEEAEERLCWLKEKIDLLDPFIEYDDELLTEDDKKELICPKSDEIQHRTTWQSFSSMYPEFTFWNNPFWKRH